MKHSIIKPHTRPRAKRPSWYHPAFGLAAVLVALPAAVHAQEQAKQADSFVDSIGINIKLNYYQDTPYTDVQKVEQVLVDAGIRHVRGGSDINSDLGKHEVAGLQKLYDDAKIKTDAVFAPSDDPILNPQGLPADQLIKSQLDKISPYVECVEGPNETDGGSLYLRGYYYVDYDWAQHFGLDPKYKDWYPFGDPNDPTSYIKFPGSLVFNHKTFPYSTIDYQNVLFDTVKHHSSYSYLPVIAPSISEPFQSFRIPGMEYVSDYGNTHSYHGARNPETIEVNKGMFNFYLPQLAKEMEYPTNLPYPTNKIMSTETGNWTGTAQDPTGYWMPPITPLSQGKYTLRTIAEYFNDGIVRTYIHELVDEYNTTDPNAVLNDTNFAERNFGIMNHDWTPKPAYTGIKNLIATLADSGPAFKTTPLTYTKSWSDPNFVRDILLQRRDGSYDLILWQPVQSYDFNNLSNIYPPSVLVTLTFPTNIGQIDLIDPSTSAAPFSTSSNVTSATVSVPDNLLILHITPQSPFPGPTAPVISMSAPTTIQAENYDIGGPGLGFNSVYPANQPSNQTGNTYRNNGNDEIGIGSTNTDPTGNGSFVGWMAPGQFLNYTVNVQDPGTYTVNFQIAAADSNPADGFTLQTAPFTPGSPTNSFTTLVLATIPPQDVLGWYTYNPVSVNVTLPAGLQTLKFYQNTGGYNLEYMTFSPTNVTGLAFGSPGAPTPGTALKLGGGVQLAAATSAPIPARAAFDGSLSTYFASAAGAGYVGQDAGKAVPVTQITYAPRPGYESRMVGGVFEGSNTSTTSGYTTLASVTATPKDGMLNVVKVAGGKSYRYLRFRSSASGYCNVAEIKFQN